MKLVLLPFKEQTDRSDRLLRDLIHDVENGAGKRIFVQHLRSLFNVMKQQGRQM